MTMQKNHVLSQNHHAKKSTQVRWVELGQEKGLKRGNDSSETDIGPYQYIGTTPSKHKGICYHIAGQSLNTYLLPIYCSYRLLFATDSSPYRSRRRHRRPRRVADLPKGWNQ